MRRDMSAKHVALMAVESALFLLGMVILMIGTVGDRAAFMHTGVVVISISLVVSGIRIIQTSSLPWLRRFGQLEIAAAIMLLIGWFIAFAW